MQACGVIKYSAEKSFSEMFINIKNIPLPALVITALCVTTQLFSACNEKRTSAESSAEVSEKSTKNKSEQISPDKTNKGDKTGGETDGKPGETNNAKESTHSSKETMDGSTAKLIVETPGAKTRHLLRYNLQDGMVALYSGEIRQLTTAPHPVGAFEVVYRFKLRQEFSKSKKVASSKEENAPGYEINYSLEDVKIQFPERLKVKSEILEQTLNRTSFKALISPQGQMLRLTDSFTGNKPTHEKQIRELSNTLPKLHPIYPDDPVGRGAIWTLETSLPMKQQTGLAKSSLQTKISTHYKANSITEVEQGSAMNLEINTKVTLDGSSSGMEVQGEGGGKGSTSILLKTGLVHSYKNLVKVVTKIKDQEASNTTAVNIKLLSLN